jgi:hypothetical protein
LPPSWRQRASFYELPAPGETAADRSDETIRNPTETPSSAVLEAELVGARALVRLLETQVEDLRRDRDGWRSQAEASQRLLVYDRDSRALVVSPTPSRPWWKRLVR